MSRPWGYLPAQPEANPKCDMNVITLRSSKELEGPQVPTREDGREVDGKGDVETEVPIETPSERVQIEKSKEVQAKHVSRLVKPYKPPVLYPHRLVKAKDEHK